MKILALNAGSNSLKFEIVSALPGEHDFGKTVLSGSYDDIGKNASKFSLLKNKHPVHEEQAAVRDYGHAAELLLERLSKAEIPEAPGLAEIDRVGHRVVHGGDYFKGPALINDEAVEKLESLKQLAPLHNESALQ